jgi:ankyrin repeat protein
LHKAAGEGKLNVVIFLCEKARVDPKVRNSTLQTPVDLALESGWNEIAEWINNFIAVKYFVKEYELILC